MGQATAGGGGDARRRGQREAEKMTRGAWSVENIMLGILEYWWLHKFIERSARCCLFKLTPFLC